MSIEKITTLQMYSILFISRILIVLTFISNIYIGYFHPNLIVAYPIAYIIMTVMFIPTYVLWKNNKNLSVVDSSRQISEGFGKVVSMIYAFYFIYTAGMGISRFVLFATSCLEPNQPGFLQIFLVVIAASYIAWLGIETLGRTTNIVLVLICIGILLIFIGLVGKIDELNFEPIMYDGFAGIGKNTLSIISNTSEIIALGFLLPHSSGNVKKGYVFWSLGVIVFIYTIVMATIGTLGTFVNVQLFPVYTSTVLSGVGVLQRLDALQTGIWLSGIVLKVAYLMILSVECLGNLSPKTKRKSFIPVAGVIMMIIAFAAQKSINMHDKMSSFPGNMIMLMLLLLVIPTIVLIGTKLKRRRTSEKCC